MHQKMCIYLALNIYILSSSYGKRHYVIWTRLENCNKINKTTKKQLIKTNLVASEAA